jgi:hypothetical protein
LALKFIAEAKRLEEEIKKLEEFKNNLADLLLLLF